MPKLIDLTGQKFNRLRVVARFVGKRQHWICICGCGEYVVVRGGDLKNNNTMSCGCLAREVLRNRNLTHGMTKTKEHLTWKRMRQRCLNPNNPDFKYYGSRGITISKEWDSFETFFKDMGERPIGLTLERNNTNLGYSKNNCCWATRTKQVRNRGLMGNNKTGVNGVYFSKSEKKYKAKIGINNKRHHIGTFSTLEQATKARKQAELKYW